MRAPSRPPVDSIRTKRFMTGRWARKTGAIRYPKKVYLFTGGANQRPPWLSSRGRSPVPRRLRPRAIAEHRPVHLFDLLARPRRPAQEPEARRHARIAREAANVHAPPHRLPAVASLELDEHAFERDSVECVPMVRVRRRHGGRGWWRIDSNLAGETNRCGSLSHSVNGSGRFARAGTEWPEATSLARGDRCEMESIRRCASSEWQLGVRFLGMTARNRPPQSSRETPGGSASSVDQARTTSAKRAGASRHQLWLTPWTTIPRA